MRINVRDLVDATIDDHLNVAITVTNTDDPGTVTLPTEFTGWEAATATVTDPDGAISNLTWQWSRGETASGTFNNISGATSDSYTPVAADAGKYLKARHRARVNHLAILVDLLVAAAIRSLDYTWISPVDRRPPDCLFRRRGTSMFAGGRRQAGHLEQPLALTMAMAAPYTRQACQLALAADTRISAQTWWGVVIMQSVIRSGELVLRSKPWSVIGPYNDSLMDSLFPSLNTLQRVAISLLFVGLLVSFGRATFYLPDNPVPITFQTTGVLLIGGVLGLRWSIFAILVYYFLGMAGVPVFKDGGNGWHYVTGTVTGGYLLGFVAAAVLVGYLSQHGWTRGRSLWPMLLGSLFIYVPGLLWLHYFDFGWPAEGDLFSGGMYPFIPGDLVKLMIASLVVGFGWRLADRRR